MGYGSLRDPFKLNVRSANKLKHFKGHKFLLKINLVKLSDDIRRNGVLVFELLDDRVRVQDPAAHQVRQTNPISVQPAQPGRFAGLAVWARLLGYLWPIL